MRIKYKHELKNYLSNRRIAVIKKAHKKTHNKIQLVNNRLIDKKIVEWDDEYSKDIYDPYKPDNIHAEILGYNIIAIQKDLQRALLQSSIPRNAQTELDAIKTINNVGDTITNLETERVIKNIDYIENILTKSNVDIEKYKTLIEKLPPQVSRKNILRRCIIEEEIPSSPIQDWLGRTLSRELPYYKRPFYKDLNTLSRDLERYKTHRLDYEMSIMENKQASREGYENLKETKTWIWSTLEKTRHSQMDGETVPLNSFFEVENEITGDVDYLLFPGDVVNDQNNCSNICNCGCTYEIN